MGWLGKLFGKETGKKQTMKLEPATIKEHGKEVMKMAKDPVCGMDIDPANAAATEEHQEKRYHFCSATCHDKFKAEPDKYAS